MKISRQLNWLCKHERIILDWSSKLSQSVSAYQLSKSLTFCLMADIAVIASKLYHSEDFQSLLKGMSTQREISGRLGQVLYSAPSTRKNTHDCVGNQDTRNHEALVYIVACCAECGISCEALYCNQESAAANLQVSARDPYSAKLCQSDSTPETSFTSRSATYWSTSILLELMLMTGKPHQVRFTQ